MSLALRSSDWLWPIEQLGYIIMRALRTFMGWIVGLCCFLSIGSVHAQAENSSSLPIPCKKQMICRVLLREAQIFERNNKDEKALLFYELAYERYLDPRIYVYIGRVQTKQKKYKEAMDSLQVYLDSHLDDASSALMKDALALRSEVERRERRVGQQLASVSRYSERFRTERRPRWLGPHPRDSDGTHK